MCELGIRDSEWIMTDSWESQQKEYQRTIVVLEHFHHQLNEHLKARYNREVRAMFLCGADLVESFAKPGVWAEEDVRSPLASVPLMQAQIRAILKKHGIICLERADLNLKRLIYAHDILFDHEKDIRIIPQWISNDISSTKIRSVDTLYASSSLH